MRLFVLFCFLFYGGVVTAQSVDSLVWSRQIDSLNQLSVTMMGKRQFAEAENLLQQSESLSRTHFTESSRAFAQCLYLHGRLAYAQAQVQKALEYLQKSADIRLQLLGSTHPDYIRTIHLVGITWQAIGDYPKAEKILVETRNLRAKTLGLEHPDYVWNVFSLGYLQQQQGKLDEALEQFEYVRPRWKINPGPVSPEYATCLNVMADTYLDLSEWQKAEALLFEARDIWEKNGLKNHQECGNTYDYLGNLYKSIANFKEAEYWYRQGLAIRETFGGKRHPNYAATLNNLGDLFRTSGQYTQAEPLMLEALDIIGAVFGARHPSYSLILDNLALVYGNLGRYTEADSIHTLAYQASVDNLGENHPTIAGLLFNRASTLQQAGQLTTAEKLYRQAQEIWQQSLGTESYLFVLGTYGLAHVNEARGDWASTTRYYLDLHQYLGTILKKTGLFASEDEMLRLYAMFSDKWDRAQGFALKHPNDTLISVVFDHALNVQNALLEQAVARERAMAAADSSTLAVHQQLVKAHRSLAVLYAQAPADRLPIEALEKETRGLEKKLIQQMPEVVSGFPTLHWRQIRSQLRPGEALVLFQKIAHPPTEPDTATYTALVLRHDSPVPQLLYLCRQTELDELMPSGRLAPEFYYRQWYAARRSPPGPSLYQTLWQPLESALNAINTVYYVPAGTVHQINPAAFELSPNQPPLGSRYHLVRLSSGRALLQNAPGTQPPASAMLWGGIQYETDTTQTDTLAASADWIVRAQPAGRRGWSPLPGSFDEIQAIGRLLTQKKCRVQTSTGSAAREELFKTLGQKTPSPEVLHISTHGFFLNAENTRVRKISRINGVPVTFFEGNPLLSSGLVLAGANQTWVQGAGPKGREDGLLTAYEVSRMSLPHTRLAVLSACETGLGEVDHTEGVFGLQRALKMAGARQILMTLWSVPDQPTRRFMEQFYRYWLVDGLPVQNALESAQQWMQRQEAYRSPYFWAGFVLLH